ncbi:hypothetical protein C3Z23_14305 [Salmonella enterica]|nr:hypothetical protein [Salmonella enterica]
MKPTYEQLEQQVLDMAVQLANAESKCRELAAENAELNKFITQSCYVFDGEQHEISDAYICATDGGMPETTATDAFLAEVRAQGVEMFAIEWGGHDSPYGQDAYNFADKIRQEAVQ